MNGPRGCWDERNTSDRERYLLKAYIGGGCYKRHLGWPSGISAAGGLRAPLEDRQDIVGQPVIGCGQRASAFPVGVVAHRVLPGRKNLAPERCASGLPHCGLCPVSWGACSRRQLPSSCSLNSDKMVMEFWVLGLLVGFLEALFSSVFLSGHEVIACVCLFTCQDSFSSLLFL